MSLGLDDTRPCDKKKITAARSDIAKRKARRMRHPSRIAESRGVANKPSQASVAYQKAKGPASGRTLYYLLFTHCFYCVTSWLECGPFATAVRQTGWIPVGKGEFATPDSWPVLALSWPAEIDPSR